MELNKRYLLVAGTALVALASFGLVASEASAHGGMGGFLGWGGGHDSSITEANGTATGRFVTFSVDPASGTISNLDFKDANATHPFVVSATMAMSGATNASVPLRGDAAGEHAAGRGAYVLKDGAGNVLAAEDSPRGGLAARSVNGTTVAITVPADAKIVVHDAVANWSAAGATVTYANGQTANLVVSKNATVAASGQVLTITLGPEGALAYAINPADGRGGFGEGPFGHDRVGEGRGHEGRGEGPRGGPGGFGGHGRR